MGLTISDIPNELLVATLDKFSDGELATFIPPNQRFRQIWISALKKRNKPGTPFHFGVSIFKAVKEKTLITDEYGSLLAQFISNASIPSVTLSSDEQYEGTPSPTQERFKQSSILAGITTNSSLQFLSLEITKKDGNTVIWTPYQRFIDSDHYWAIGDGFPGLNSKSSLLTKETLLWLSRVLLGSDPDFYVSRKSLSN